MSNGEFQQAMQAIIWRLPGLVFLTTSMLWTWTWSILLVINVWSSHSVHINFGVLVGMISLGPSLAGLLCILAAEGVDAGILRMMRQLSQPHSFLLWLIVPFAILPYAALAALYGTFTGGVSVALVSPSTLWSLIRSLLSGLGVAIGQVFGWQGFLTAHLLRAHSPLRAALTLGWMAAIWHVGPTFLLYWLSIEGGHLYGASSRSAVAAGVALFEALAWLPSMAILTALYLTSKGSLLLCCGWHMFYAAAHILHANSVNFLQLASDSSSLRSPVVRSATVLVFSNVLALPAWLWLVREGYRRRRSADVKSALREGKKGD